MNKIVIYVNKKNRKKNSYKLIYDYIFFNIIISGQPDLEVANPVEKMEVSEDDNYSDSPVMNFMSYTLLQKKCT